MSLIQHNLKTLNFGRTNFLDLIKDCSIEQLNTIPEGFKNNLIWNLAHNVVVQKSLVYALSGNKTNLPKELSIQYRKGQKPDRYADLAEVKLWKELAISTVADLEQDYNMGLFQQYKEYKTSTGFHLTGIDEAITFNNFHEGLHYGIAMSIIKLV